MSVEWGQYADAYKAIHDAIRSTITIPPEGRKITKIGFWEDSVGNVRYIKFYEGAELLFTLSFSNAGEASSETWSITRN